MYWCSLPSITTLLTLFEEGTVIPQLFRDLGEGERGGKGASLDLVDQRRLCESGSALRPWTQQEACSQVTSSVFSPQRCPSKPAVLTSCQSALRVLGHARACVVGLRALACLYQARLICLG